MISLTFGGIAVNVGTISAFFGGFYKLKFNIEAPQRVKGSKSSWFSLFNVEFDIAG